MVFVFQAKVRSEKARAKVYENALKSVHQQRQEAAQNRRDEQRRAAKERIMAEEDPEKARRLEVGVAYCSYPGSNS